MQEPTPPVGWELIAPADARPGDGVLPDGQVEVVGAALFEPYPVELRRRSWAVRRTDSNPA